MRPQLINHSPDLERLWNEGLEIEIKGGFILIHNIPYVNTSCQINKGTLVSVLCLAGDVTTRPLDHVVHFIGDKPCDKHGNPLNKIINSSNVQQLSESIVCNHLFSSRPQEGYPDYYEKMMNYINIITGPAKHIDPTVTEKTFRVVEQEDENSVFNYIDTNSSDAHIGHISNKLSNQKIAIIGLGGTGSYILDYISKSPVAEIHLFDGDIFLQKNSFRAPSAASIEQLRERYKKTEYYKDIYSKLHRHIISHDYYVDSSNFTDLSEMDFVFICIDKGLVKKTLVEYLESMNIKFIDVGMGVNIIEDKLIGTIRVTTSTPDKRDHIHKRISFSDMGENDYSKNIQIIELNALNAALAVIKWKKLYGFYHDLEKEYNCTYVVDGNTLINNDNET